MEFNRKLQELRKSRNMTQEDLSEALNVSRAAISKWESGRGYPGIDSLKSISKYFSVSIDDLLSNSEVLDVCEEETSKNAMGFITLVFGLADLSSALFIILPIFGQEINDIFYNVSLLQLAEIQPYTRILFYAAIISSALFGILNLSLQNCQYRPWALSKHKISLALSMASVLLFIICSQPYAAAFSFIFLIFKVMTLLKKH